MRPSFRFSCVLAASAGLSVLLLAFVAALGHERASAFEPYSYNESRSTEGGTVTSVFHGKFVNYLDEDQQWQAIDLAFTKDRSGFHMTSAPYELHAGLYSTDDVQFVSTNRYDVDDHTVRDDPPLGKMRRFTTARSVEGTITPEGILYRGAFPDLDASLLLQPHEMEARYLVVWDTSPASCDENVVIPFEETYDEGVPRTRDGEPVPAEETVLEDGFYVQRNDFRGIGTPRGRVWDSGGKSADVLIVGSFENGVFTGKKIVPCEFFDDAVYPVYTDDTSTFYPDANPETNTVDGVVVNTDATGFSQTDWDTFHDDTGGGSAQDSSTGDDFARTGKTSAGFTGNRGFLLFDTSSLAASAIDAATVSLYVTGKNNGDNDGDDFIVLVHPANPASNTAIGAADWDQCGSVDSPTEASSRIDIGSITTSAYNDFTVTNLSTINTSGITKYCGREGHDVLDSPYAGSTDTYNAIAISLSEFSGSSQDPKLVVTHTPGSDLSIEKTGDAQAASGATVVYSLLVENLGTATASGVFVKDAIPSGFVFSSTGSSADCSSGGGYVTCGTFNLTYGSSTGRTIAFQVAIGTCGVQRTNTATVSGATVVDLIPGNNTGSKVTSIVCPAVATSVRKSADESVTSSTTLQNDDHLRLTLSGGTTYAVRGAIFATSTSGTPDIKIAYTVPSGATMDLGFLSGFAGNFNRAELLETSGSASAAIPIGANQNTIIHVLGTVELGVTSGDLTLQWAQNTSNGNATVVKEGSFLSVEAIE